MAKSSDEYVGYLEKGRCNASGDLQSGKTRESNVSSFKSKTNYRFTNRLIVITHSSLIADTTPEEISISMLVRSHDCTNSNLNFVTS